MSGSKNKLLITGGRGRLACVIADWFGREEAGGVRLFSRQGGDGLESLQSLLDPQVLSGGDVVLHLACSSLPATAEQQSGLAEREDIPLLRRLLTALQTLPPTRRPHLIFFSSGGAVYGNATGSASVETDACRPIGAYGRAKVEAEQMIKAWSMEKGATYTILRISNPYGFSVPRDRSQGIIPHAIRAALTGSPLTLWGDGSARKDFIHYTDFLSALSKVIVMRPVGTFNLSSGVSHTLNDVLACVERLTGRKIIRSHMSAAAWDVNDSRLANDRLRSATGWSPVVGLNEGIQLSLSVADIMVSETQLTSLLGSVADTKRTTLNSERDGPVEGSTRELL